MPMGKSLEDLAVEMDEMKKGRKQERFGPLLDENQARSILDEIKQVITASASRKGERAERTNTEDFDAEPGEEKQVFYQVRWLESVGEAKDKTAEERRQAICIFDDVAEQCQPRHYDHVPCSHIPLESNANDGQFVDIGQVLVGVGVNVARNMERVCHLKPFYWEMLFSGLKLTVIIRVQCSHTEIVMAYDMAGLSAVGKLIIFNK
ncbi:importin-5-like protein [Tanacetum coccineum]|uniref:Importin-5-like protein n=1 Tax=Tanacetum coccineum TaxID=301880 RepID=A0ABQ4X7G8_9ASTR